MSTTKSCSRCQEVKPLSKFNRKSAAPDGKRSECKECAKVDSKNRYHRDRNHELLRNQKYHNTHKEGLAIKRKKRESADPEKYARKSREYRSRRLEHIKSNQSRLYNSPVVTSTYLDRMPPNDKAFMKDGVLHASCKTCGKVFPPSYSQVVCRTRAYAGKIHGECNLYCSDDCKKTCPLFKFNPNNTDPRSMLFTPRKEEENIHNKHRKRKRRILAHQCDTDGENTCEKCGDFVGAGVELHHSHPVAKYGWQSDNIESMMLLCAGCHVELHRRCAA